MYEQKQCILIADDEERIVRALKDLLSAKGFHTLTAGNGRAALELCERYRNQIDLALLDVMMPELDGFALLRELRGRNYVLPVIMLTARGEEYDQLQGFQAGADDYVPKPFSTSLLLARIEAVLRRAGRGKAEVMRAGKLLLVKDSYANCLVPFLAQHFAEIHVVDLRYFNMDIYQYIEENDIARIAGGFMFRAFPFFGTRKTTMPSTG